MLNHNEAGLPRRIRRALAAKQRTRIAKSEPFGRIAITAYVEGLPGYTRDCIEYTHMTKGRMVRAMTDELAAAIWGRA
jgi:hypothetical protein